MSESMVRMGKQTSFARWKKSKARKRKSCEVYGNMTEEELSNLSSPLRKSCKSDTVQCARAYMRIPTRTFIGSKSVAYEISEGKDIPEHVRTKLTADLVKYLKGIGYEAHCVLVQLLEEVLEQDFKHMHDSQLSHVQFCRSAYVSAIQCPRSTDIQQCGKVQVFDGDERIVQRVFASTDYYGSSKPRFDSVMLHAGVKVNDGEIMSEVWFGKLLGILRLKCKSEFRPGSGICMQHNVDGCDVCSGEQIREFAFVRYYEVVSSDKVPEDGVDAKLGCIRLIWETYGREDMSKGIGNEYALFPLDAV